MKKIALLSVLGLMAMGTAYADIDNMNIGGDFMAEYFFADQATTLSDAGNDEADFIRTEGHLWFQADLDDNVMARISLEFYRGLDQTNSNNYGFGGARFGSTGGLDVFLEEAFVKVSDIAGSGFSASVGRQFLNFGDDPNADNFNRWWGPGFIIADGNPDCPFLLTDMGSYEIDPFDAIVVSYSTEVASVSLLYARAFEDNFVGINSDSGLTALYGSYFGFEGHQIDAYFTWADNNQDKVINEGNRYIFGLRAAGDIMPELAYKAEFAYQTDDLGNGNLGPEFDAFAAQAGLNYHPDVNYKPNVGFIYTYLQGDTDKGVLGGFEAPFEGKTFGLLYEGLAKFYGLGYFSNTNVFNLNGGFEPFQNIAWTADLYYYLMDEENPISKDEDGGFEIDSQVDYKFNDNLTTFLGGGMLFPGDGLLLNSDDAYFFRTGVKVKF